MSESLRDKSRRVFVNDANTTENINCGSFQRIADACELMASNYTKLQSENERLKSSLKYWQERTEKAERKISSYKGVITKLKNRNK